MSLGWVQDSPKNLRSASVIKHLPDVQKLSTQLHLALGVTPNTRIIGAVEVTTWKLPEPPKQTMDQALASLKQRLERPAKQEGAVVDDPDETEVESSDDEDAHSSAYSEGPDELLWFPPKCAEDAMDEDEDDELLYDAQDRDRDYDFDDTGLEDREQEAGEITSDSSNGEPDYDEPQCGGNQGVKRRLSTTSASEQNKENIDRSKRQKVVIDLTHGTLTPSSNDNKPRQATLQLHFNKPKITKVPASPPPIWMPHTRDIGMVHLPAYWSATLTLTLARWIELTGTKSAQTFLSRVELKSVAQKSKQSGGIAYIRGSNGLTTLTITRLQLPPSAQGSTSPPLSRNWIAIQANYVPDLPAGYATQEQMTQMMKAQQGILAYWLIAFPEEAVTSSEVKKMRVFDNTIKARGPRSTMKERSRSMEVMTLQLSTGGKAPLVHGKGVNQEFCQAFIAACVDGNGVVELWNL